MFRKRSWDRGCASSQRTPRCADRPCSTDRGARAGGTQIIAAPSASTRSISASVIARSCPRLSPSSAAETASRPRCAAPARTEHARRIRSSQRSVMFSRSCPDGGMTSRHPTRKSAKRSGGTKYSCRMRCGRSVSASAATGMLRIALRAHRLARGGARADHRFEYQRRFFAASDPVCARNTLRDR